MRQVFLSTKIVTEAGEISGFLTVEDGKITAVEAGKPTLLPTDEVRDLGDGIVIPGMIEIHSHGAGGHAFTDSTPEEVAAGCDFHLAHGTTSILPTVTAGPFDRMAAAARNVRTVMENGLSRANVLGVHLEGPYLSKKQAGAQCPSFITPPNPDDYLPFLDEMAGILRRWDYAPENDPDGRFAKELTARGVLAAAGHTDATYEEMRPAMQNGLSLVTHLYSCTSTVTRKMGFRSLGVIETAFLSDNLAVEIIADGKHLPPELIRMIVKIKGRDKVALITDSLAIAGTDVTRGTMSGTDFIVEDGVCKLTDRSAFAGSVATSDRLLRVLVFDCGASLTDAVYMAATTPANLLGVSTKGRLAAGCDADVAVLSPDLTVREVYVAGEKAV